MVCERLESTFKLPKESPFLWSGCLPDALCAGGSFWHTFLLAAVKPTSQPWSATPWLVRNHLIWEWPPLAATPFPTPSLTSHSTEPKLGCQGCELKAHMTRKTPMTCQLTHWSWLSASHASVAPLVLSSVTLMELLWFNSTVINLSCLERVTSIKSSCVLMNFSYNAI